MRFPVPTASFDGVAAGSTATLDVAPKDTYHKLQLTYTTATAGGANLANMEAELTEFRLKVNGIVQRTFSMAQLNSINAFYGVPFSAGIVPIFFSEPWARSVGGEELMAWHMGDVNDFQLEVDIDAGATTPTLTGLAVKSKSDLAMGSINKWRRNRVQVAATGVLTYTGFNREEPYLGMHAFETTAADISEIEILSDQERVFKATNAQATALYADHGLTMQTGVFSYVPRFTTQLNDALAVTRAGNDGQPRRISELRADFTMAVAASFDLVQEVQGLRD